MSALERESTLSWAVSKQFALAVSTVQSPICFHQSSLSSPVALKTGRAALALSLAILPLTLRLVPFALRALLALVLLPSFVGSVVSSTVCAASSGLLSLRCPARPSSPSYTYACVHAAIYTCMFVYIYIYGFGIYI